MFFYRTQVGAEVDLVLISPSGKKTCIEIKLSNSPTVSKGFYESLKDLNPDRKFVLVPTEESYLKAGDAWVCNLLDFLQNRLPMLD